MTFESKFLKTEVSATVENTKWEGYIMAEMTAMGLRVRLVWESPEPMTAWERFEPWTDLVWKGLP